MTFGYCDVVMALERRSDEKLSWFMHTFAKRKRV
ncbi:hypothetical protein SAMN05446935_8062 [Burkholderia sp. YR290]|nr:hypothetical protein PMI06_008831 [Burkholderia sp. BT03]SKC53289.1 hypothetical protein SAMN06266956_0575 [Paraburkholderia hospita]SOE87434.1 hypothetical protein SAMN05446935_8062 [Burkholderia sp. YR290]